MNSRAILILMSISGLAMVFWGLRPQTGTKAQRPPMRLDTTQANSEFDTPRIPPSQPSGPSQSTEQTKPTPSASSKTEPQQEPYMRHYEEDSPKKIAELKALYAPGMTLDQTLKIAKLVPVWKGVGLIDEGVFKLNDGRLASFRRFWRITPDGQFSKESCFSLRLPGQEPLVGQFSDGTLTMYELPEPYSHIYGLHQTYFFLDVVEFSRWRAEWREEQPSIFNLYQKQTSGQTLLIGEWLKASIDGVAHSDPFQMPARRYCETVPEPRAD